MENWKTYKLDELYDFSSGLSKPRSQFGSGHQFLSFKDVFYNYFVPEELEQLVQSTEEEQKSCSVERGDVFLTRTSETMGELGMSSVALRTYDRATFNGFTKRLRPKHPDQIIPEYAAYYFRSPSFRQEVTAMSSLSTRASLNNEMLSRLKMVLPPIGTQEAIGRILKAFDDKIELNRRMNATLEAMARALFKAWFVDFEPVQANKENLPSTSASPEIAKLFPSTFENGIPKGWRKEKLGDHLEVVRGLSYKGSGLAAAGHGLPMNNLNSVYEGGGYKYEGIKYYSGDFKERHITKPGDIIVANTEQGHKHLLIGFPAIVPEYFGEKMLFSHHIYRVRPNEGSLLKPQFIYYLLLTPHIRDVITGCSSGTTVNMLKIDGLQIPLFVLPSQGIVESFSNVIASFWKRQEELYKENQTLAELRDSLLPRLIEGTIRVEARDRGVAIGEERAPGVNTTSETARL